MINESLILGGLLDYIYIFLYQGLLSFFQAGLSFSVLLRKYDCGM